MLSRLLILLAFQAIVCICAKTQASRPSFTHRATSYGRGRSPLRNTHTGSLGRRSSSVGSSGSGKSYFTAKSSTSSLKFNSLSLPRSQSRSSQRSLQRSTSVGSSGSRSSTFVKRPSSPNGNVSPVSVASSSGVSAAFHGKTLPGIPSPKSLAPSQSPSSQGSLQRSTSVGSSGSRSSTFVKRPSSSNGNVSPVSVASSSGVSAAFHGKTLPGIPSPKSLAPSQSPSSQGSSSSRPAEGARPASSAPRKSETFNQLKEMFPNHDPVFIGKILRGSRNPTDAADYLLKFSPAGGTLARNPVASSASGLSAASNRLSASASSPLSARSQSATTSAAEIWTPKALTDTALHLKSRFPNVPTPKLIEVAKLYPGSNALAETHITSLGIDKPTTSNGVGAKSPFQGMKDAFGSLKSRLSFTFSPSSTPKRASVFASSAAGSLSVPVEMARSASVASGASAASIGATRPALSAAGSLSVPVEMARSASVASGASANPQTLTFDDLLLHSNQLKSASRSSSRSSVDSASSSLLSEIARLNYKFL